MTARASSLPMAETCGHHMELSERYPESSVYSLRGDAFHAGAAAAEIRSHIAMKVYADCLAALDDAARLEVTAMVGQWLEARPAVAPPSIEVEITLALDQDGLPCSPDAEGAIVGHGDACWSADGVASVLDHKTGQHRNYDLQLGFYALAYAAAKGADRFRHACAYHEPRKAPEIVWSPIIPVDSPEAEALWQRILRAATKDRKPVTGPHCGSCFQRKHCTAHLAPAMGMAHEALRPIMEGEGGLTKANDARALRIYKSMSDVLKIVKSQLEAHADANGGIFDGDKVWKGWERQGREYVDVEALKRDGLYEKYAKRGGSYFAYDWRKIR